MPSATTITHHQEPHINGGESGLDGSVPDLRNKLIKLKSFAI